MRKSEVQTHRSGYGGPDYPAINVKYYGRMPHNEVMERFGCDLKTAERALEFVWNSAVEQFWDFAEQEAREIFGFPVEVYSGGRSGGWLLLYGLHDVESWDAIMLGRYARMVKWCKAEIAYRTSVEYVLEEIEANEWAKPGAELYNFVDTADGTKCVADLKAQAIEQGFGAVVRK